MYLFTTKLYITLLLDLDQHFLTICFVGHYTFITIHAQQFKYICSIFKPNKRTFNHEVQKYDISHFNKNQIKPSKL